MPRPGISTKGQPKPLTTGEGEAALAVYNSLLRVETRK